MTRKEAINLMQQGVKVTHKYFTSDEWMTMNSAGEIVLEDGVEVAPAEFWQWRTDKCWDDGYSVYNS